MQIGGSDVRKFGKWMNIFYFLSDTFVLRLMSYDCLDEDN
jgi:hypothetical protein